MERDTHTTAADTHTRAHNDRQRDALRTRFIAISAAKLDADTRTLELSFSSEHPVRRWFGNEVLSHAPDAPDLTLLNDGANLLLNHDLDRYIGVVENARLDPDRKCRATVRFGTNPLAEQIFADIRTGILRQVSVGYRSLAEKLTATDAQGNDTYTVTRWQPYEISIVTAAADPSVGIGRSAPFPNNQQHHTANMPPPIDTANRAATAPADETATAAPQPAQATPPTASTRSITTNEHAAHMPNTQHSEPDTRATAAQIRAIADTYRRSVPNAPDLALQAIAEGHDTAQFQRTLLDAIHQRTVRGVTESANIGLDAKDTQRFSFVRFLRAATATARDRNTLDECAFEIEVSEAAAKRMSASGRHVRGMVIPTDILHGAGLTRGIVSSKTGTGYAGTGDNIIADTYLPGSFQEILRNNCALVRNCTALTGLQGTFTLPKQLTGASANWIGEDDNAPETDITFGQDSLSHKTVASYTQITRDMLHQPSLDVEAYVRRELAIAAATAIDTAGFYGTGTGAQPKGIKNYTGIPAVTFTGGNPDYTNIVAMETSIAAANADIGSKRYIFSASTRGKLKTTKRFASSGTDTVLWEPGNTVNGYPTDISEQIHPTDIFFGIWSEFFYAVWGGLEILADQVVRNGRIEVSAFQDVNFLLRRPECFCFGDLSVPPPTP